MSRHKTLSFHPPHPPASMMLIYDGSPEKCGGFADLDIYLYKQAHHAKTISQPGKCSSRNMSWLTFSHTLMPRIGITLNRDSLQPFDFEFQSPEDHPLLYKWNENSIKIPWRKRSPISSSFVKCERNTTFFAGSIV